MWENSDGDGSIHRAGENLKAAYRLLNDPTRDRELYDALTFARTVVAPVDGVAFAAAWLNRQAALIRREVGA